MDPNIGDVRLEVIDVSVDEAAINRPISEHDTLSLRVKRQPSSIPSHEQKKETNGKRSFFSRRKREKKEFIRRKSSILSPFTQKSELIERNRVFALEALDSNSDDVIAITGAKASGLKRRWNANNAASFDAFRTAYRLRKQEKRESNNASKVIEMLKLLLQVDFYQDRIYKFLNSKKRYVLFIFIDLLVDILFSIMYLVEVGISSAVGNPAQPGWLFIWRPHPLWVLAVTMSFWNLLSFFTRLYFSESRTKALFSWYTLLDLFTSIPFIVSLGLVNGQYLWVPYFLRSWVVVLRLRRALNLKSDLRPADPPFDPLKLQLIILVAYILCILYNGMAAFQYCELSFAGVNHSIVDSFYFILITISTVGYGDISPTGVESRIVVMFLIIIALAALPSMISSTVDLYIQSKAGGGHYHPGNSRYVIVCGNFENTARVQDVLGGLIHNDYHSTKHLKIVFLALTPPNRSVKAILDSLQYRQRVSYLEGSAMDEQDLKRARAKNASAIFTIADREGLSAAEEDERNTLRVWTIHCYTNAPIYSHNLLPGTAVYQMMAKEVVCIDEFKQVLLGYSCLYQGAATLIMNLLHQSEPLSTYESSWQAQYGDGAGNELYDGSINPIFVGFTFAQISWYLYQEFQVCTVAVDAYIESKNSHHLVLNPGNDYHLHEKDRLLYIAQGPEDIDIIAELTAEQFKRSLESHPSYNLFRSAKTDQRGDASYSVLIDRTNLLMAPNQADLIVGLPAISNDKVPLCYILKHPPTTVDNVRLVTSGDMCDHIVVCLGGGNVDISRFLCTVRAAHIGSARFRDIIVITRRLPTTEEFELLAQFPGVFYLEGDCRLEKDLNRAGLLKAEKVIIMGQNITDKTDDSKEGFTSGFVIMACHAVFQLLPPERRSSVTVELSERSDIRFMNLMANITNPSGDFFHEPAFASGNAIVASLLDNILYQTYHKPFILDAVKRLCGVHYQHTVELERSLGVQPAYLSYISVPDMLIGKTYMSAYELLALKEGVVPIGLLRAVSNDLDNHLPFVFTNPLPQVLLRKDDLIYVLKAD